jgi:hypothetical protein
MLVKGKVYVAESEGTLTERRSDVEKLKKALRKVYREYRQVLKRQRSFEAALGELCAITTRWSIPPKGTDPLLRELRRR